MYYSGPGVLILAALILSSCAREPAAGAAVRIAVLRFENLSGDASLSWMGRAFSEVIAGELMGAPGMQTISSVRLHAYDRLLGARPVSAPGISTESTQARLAGATRIVYGGYAFRNGKLEAQITIEDPEKVQIEAASHELLVRRIPGPPEETPRP